MYQNSKQHMINLSKARAVAYSKPKLRCKYCNKSRTKGNLAKHENSCYLNPLHLKRCSVCSEPLKNYKTATTCSHSCSNKQFRSGPNNGNWKENRYASTCFHYHKKKCVVCSETNIVAVHHMNENHNDNRPENLIPLCPTHHQYMHSRFKHLIENQVQEYILNWKSKPDALPS